MKKVLMMLFIGIIVSSCLNEEEKKIMPEGSYKLPSTVTLGKVRMYTSKGEVTDEAKIKKFLSGISRSNSQYDPMDYAGFFSFDSSSRPIGDENYLDITFHPDEAVVQTNLLSDSGIDPDSPYGASVFKYSNLFIVSKGKSAMDIPITSITEFFERDKVKKISTESHYVNTSISYMPGRINFALLEQNGQFVLPFLTYVHGRYLRHDNKSYYVESTCNMLNTDFLNHVPVSDTIVVQESWAILQKQ